MARFPRTEPEIAALAQELAVGLAANPLTYPAPPVAPANLQSDLASYVAAREAAVAAQAAAKQATAAKADALAALAEGVRRNLRYAEGMAEGDDAKLSLLGWGARKAMTPLQAPGQPLVLEATRQGAGWIFLHWKQPPDGGKVAAYKVERRLCPDGPWVLGHLAMESEVTLRDQERGKEFEYRVVAVNKAGESEASNTVMAVL